MARAAYISVFLFSYISYIANILTEHKDIISAPDKNGQQW